jgi:hypothetical protein
VIEFLNMKRLLPIAFLLILACATEEKVGPSQAATFVRYFNGGSNDEAQAVIQTADNGFLILANTAIKASELVGAHYKIKLIKTDEFGNQLWQKFYPEFGQDVDNTVAAQPKRLSRKGHAIISVDGGYVIAGEDIQNGGTLSQLMIMSIDSEGNSPIMKVIKPKKGDGTYLSISGLGIAKNSSGNYLVLGSISNSSDEINMGLVEFKPTGTTLDSIWSAGYGAGEVTLANRLFLDGANSAFWGGTVYKDNSTAAIRFVKIETGPSNPGGILGDLPVSQPGFIESGNDFCRYGAGFAVIGSTNKKTTTGDAGDFDILFKRISANGTELSSQSFIVGNTDGDFKLNETGRAICATRDGGLLLLGTVESNSVFGRGDKDYYLIKIDAFGETLWTKDYGSKFEDIGVNVTQSNDGGYIVLGTTSLGRVKTIMLMKTDKNGNIE